jgi:hypothetical protein
MNINSFKRGLNKFTNLKPSHLVVLVGLLTVVLLVVGLRFKREGFSSMANAKNSRTEIVDNLNDAINAVTWNNYTDKSNVIANINYFYNKMMIYFFNQGGVDLQSYDLNNNNYIYQLRDSLKGTRDTSGNMLPWFVDNKSPTSKFLKKYTILDVTKSITLEELKALLIQIRTRVNKFSDIDPKGYRRLITSFEALLEYGINLGQYLLETNRPLTNSANIPSFQNILSQGTYRRNIYPRSKSSEHRAPLRYHDDHHTPINYQNLMKNHLLSHHQPNDTSGMYMLKTAAVPPANPPGASSYSSGATAPAPAAPAAQAPAAPAPAQAQAATAQTSGATAPAQSSQNVSGFSANDSTNPSPAQTCGAPAPVPPCPPCERCPEPAFDCKKVPNYKSASVNQYLPQPMLADFSQFGM